MFIEPEVLWLRPRVIRMRALLRHVKVHRVEMALKELIADAEDRLEALEEQARKEKLDRRPKKTPVAVKPES